MGHINSLSRQVIGAAIAVHRALGPGMLESVYERCLALELKKRRIPFEQQKRLPVTFQGVPFESAYRADLLIDKRLLVEVKAVKSLQPVHHAQVVSYLKLSGCHLRLLLNFNVPALRVGIRRVVRGDPDAPPERR